jgi:hypothetical protein
MKNSNANVRNSLDALDIARARCLRAERALSLAAARGDDGAGGAGRIAGSGCGLAVCGGGDAFCGACAGGVAGFGAAWAASGT